METQTRTVLWLCPCCGEQLFVKSKTMSRAKWRLENDRISLEKKVTRLQLALDEVKKPYPHQSLTAEQARNFLTTGRMNPKQPKRKKR